MSWGSRFRSAFFQSWRQRGGWKRLAFTILGGLAIFAVWIGGRTILGDTYVSGFFAGLAAVWVSQIHGHAADYIFKEHQ